MDSWAALAEAGDALAGVGAAEGGLKASDDAFRGLCASAAASVAAEVAAAAAAANEKPAAISHGAGTRAEGEWDVCWESGRERGEAVKEGKRRRRRRRRRRLTRVLWLGAPRSGGDGGLFESLEQVLDIADRCQIEEPCFLPCGCWSVRK